MVCVANLGTKQSGVTMGFKEFYDKHYMKLVILTVLLLVFGIGQIVYQVASTGDFINRGVSLKGGITVSVMKEYDVLELENYLKDKLPKADISVRELARAGSQIGVMIDAADVSADDLIVALKEKITDLKSEDYSIESMGSSLGASFFKETFTAIILAFIFMAVVVFIYFRVPVPSVAVVLCAFSDMVVTLAIVNLIGMKLSTAGIAAFLMLIGYSVDTDILLSTRMLKRKEGSVLDRTIGAFKTGAFMTATTVAAIAVGLIFAQSPVLKEIMIIILIGLLVDMPNTWIQNAGILRWYIERKQKKAGIGNV